MVGMKRGRGRWLAAAAAVTVLSGCGTTIGDGKVVDDWALMADAKPKIPPTGACYITSIANAKNVNAMLNAPVPCTGSHTVETFHVGQFPDSVTAVPAEGSADYWRAFDDCETQAAGFLGGDWYNARLVVAVEAPFSRQWDGGGRWYRCELLEIKGYSDVVISRTGSLRDALKTDGPLAHHCVTVVGKKERGWDDLAAIDCAQPHDAEFAGTFKVPGVEYPNDEQRDSIFDGCWDVVARYLGGSQNRIQVGWLAWGLGEIDWKLGDHRVRCYAWRSDRKMTGSVKGIGNASPR
jgi:hypothetical protein